MVNYLKLAQMKDPVDNYERALVLARALDADGLFGDVDTHIPTMISNLLDKAKMAAPKDGHS
jgi:hypothetical protein